LNRFSFFFKFSYIAIISLIWNLWKASKTWLLHLILDSSLQFWAN
jgi:hypothetical protein